MRYLLVTVFLLILGGCSLKTTVPAITEYHITMPSSVFTKGAKCLKNTIKVALIQSPNMFKSTQMFYADARLRQYSYNTSSWSESPTSRLQTIFVSGLSQSQLFGGVVGYQSLASYDYLVELHLYDFMQYLREDGTSYVHMSFDVVIIESDNRVVVSKFHFNETKESDSVDATGGVIALNALVQKSATQALKWTALQCK